MEMIIEMTPVEKDRIEKIITQSIKEILDNQFGASSTLMVEGTICFINMDKRAIVFKIFENYSYTLGTAIQKNNMCEDVAMEHLERKQLLTNHTSSTTSTADRHDLDGHYRSGFWHQQIFPVHPQHHNNNNRIHRPIPRKLNVIPTNDPLHSHNLGAMDKCKCICCSTRNLEEPKQSHYFGITTEGLPFADSNSSMGSPSSSKSSLELQQVRSPSLEYESISGDEINDPLFWVRNASCEKAVKKLHSKQKSIDMNNFLNSPINVNPDLGCTNPNSGVLSPNISIKNMEIKTQLMHQDMSENSMFRNEFSSLLPDKGYANGLSLPTNSAILKDIIRKRIIARYITTLPYKTQHEKTLPESINQYQASISQPNIDDIQEKAQIKTLYPPMPGLVKISSLEDDLVDAIVTPNRPIRSAHVPYVHRDNGCNSRTEQNSITEEPIKKEIKRLHAITSYSTKRPKSNRKNTENNNNNNSDNKPLPRHMCAFCSKRFRFKSKYLEHLPVHTRERLYSCSLCSKTYKNKYYLQIHLRTHIGIPTKSSVCPFCKVKFDSNRLLRLHIVEHHMKEMSLTNINNNLRVK